MVVDKTKVSFGIVSDLQDLIARKGSLPSYVSKEQVCQDLAVILESKFTPSQKNETISIYITILPDISQSGDWISCINTIMPHTVKLIGEPQCHDKAVASVQESLKTKPSSSHCVMKILAKDGIMKDERLAKEVINLLPGIVTESVNDTNHAPVIEALFYSLEKPPLEQPAFGALLRYKDALTDKYNLEYYTRSVPDKQRKLFGVLCKGCEDKEFFVNGRKAPDGRSFAIIPNTTINRLIDKTIRSNRGEGSDMLRDDIESSKHLDLLVPYLKSFLTFLTGFMEDANIKVVNNILEVVIILLKRLKQDMKRHQKLVIKMLMTVSTDSKLVTKKLLYENIKMIMTNSNTQEVVNELFEYVGNKNSRVREDVLNLISFSLLTFPSSDFDLEDISQGAAGLLTDAKRRVRQAALECISITAQCLGNQKLQVFYDYVCHMEKKERTFGEIIAAVKTRVSRKSLPKLSSDGLVEYGLKIPVNYERDYAKHYATSRAGQDMKANQYNFLDGADLEWIMKGSGQLSKGSAGLSISSGESISSSRLGIGVGSHSRTPSRERYVRPMSKTGSQRKVSTESSRDISPYRNDQNSPPKGRRRSRSELFGLPEKQNNDNSYARPRTPSLPEVGNKTSNEKYERIRSTSFYDDKTMQSKPVIPKIDGRAASKDKIINSCEDQRNKFSNRNDSRPIKGMDKEDPYDLSDDDDILESPSKKALSDSLRKQVYATVPRSESVPDLRKIPDTLETKFDPVPEESLKLSRSEVGSSDGGKKAVMSRQNSKLYDSRRSTLVSLGLSGIKHRTQFDNEDEKNADGPGAFENPSKALDLAVVDLTSEEWEVEVAALAALVRIVTWHSNLLKNELGTLLELVLHEVKNLRSQVCRAAVQTFTKLFATIGRNIEKERKFEEIVQTLLLKTGETNRFLRSDAEDALDMMIENVSIHKGVTAVINSGMSTKTVMVRICVARLLVHVVTALGADTFFSSSSDTFNPVLIAGSELIEDGSLEVRTHAKSLFRVLLLHENFEDLWKAALDNNSKVNSLQKTINSLK